MHRLKFKYLKGYILAREILFNTGSTIRFDDVYTLNSPEVLKYVSCLS